MLQLFNFLAGFLAGIITGAAVAFAYRAAFRLSRRRKGHSFSGPSPVRIEADSEMLKPDRTQHSRNDY